MGGFPHLRPPTIFFKNRALSLLHPYGALTSCKKLEKSLEQSLRYLKADHGRTSGPRTKKMFFRIYQKQGASTWDVSKV